MVSIAPMPDCYSGDLELQVHKHCCVEVLFHVPWQNVCVCFPCGVDGRGSLYNATRLVSLCVSEMQLIGHDIKWEKLCLFISQSCVSIIGLTLESFLTGKEAIVAITTSTMG